MDRVHFYKNIKNWVGIVHPIWCSEWTQYAEPGVIFQAWENLEYNFSSIIREAAVFFTMNCWNTWRQPAATGPKLFKKFKIKLKNYRWFQVFITAKNQGHSRSLTRDVSHWTEIFFSWKSCYASALPLGYISTEQNSTEQKFPH